MSSPMTATLPHEDVEEADGRDGTAGEPGADEATFPGEAAEQLGGEVSANEVERQVGAPPAGEVPDRGGDVAGGDHVVGSSDRCAGTVNGDGGRAGGSGDLQGGLADVAGGPGDDGGLHCAEAAAVHEGDVGGG